MRIAHLSDLHVTEGKRLVDQAADLARIVDDVLSLSPDLVVLTGDYYGRTVPHRPTPRERAVLEPAVVRLAEAAPVVVLAGNHDHGESLELTRHLGGTFPIRTITGAQTFQVQTPAGPVWIYGVAYPTKRWLLRSRLKAAGAAESTRMATESLIGLLGAWAGRVQRRRIVDPTIPQVFLGHFLVAGAYLSSGEVLSTGEIEIPRAALEGLAVDYGGLGHIHARQGVADRWFYAGNPWPCDFGERGARGWILVDIGGDPDVHDPLDSPSWSGAPIPGGTWDGWSRYGGELGGRLPVAVQLVKSGARPWITLRWRWAADREDGDPRWVERPSAEDLEEVAGAEVRAQLVVPDAHVASCPWAAELAELETRNPHRVTAERTIEPTHRIRAPAVAAAATLAGKVEAYWSTLESPPEDHDRAAAMDALAELEQEDDQSIAEAIAGLLDSAQPPRAQSDP